MNARPRSCQGLECIFPLMLFFAGAAGFCQTAAPDYLAALRAKDSLQRLQPVGSEQPAVYGFASTLVMKATNVFDPSQGMQIRRSEVAWTKDWHVMKTVCDYDAEPVFNPKGIPGVDYDSQGNFILNRCLEEYVVSQNDRNDVLQKVVSYLVSPDNKVLSAEPCTIRFRYVVGSDRSTYTFGQLCMASGWGFGEEISEILKTDAGDPSLVTIEAKGTRGKGLRGRWLVSIENGEDPLVRRASFVAEGTTHAAVEVSNSGVVECPGLRIARSGIFAAESYRAQFDILEVRGLNRSDVQTNQLHEAILKLMDAPLPAKSREIDLRK